MEPNEILSLVIRPTLHWLGPRYAKPEAETMLLAIAIQESDLRYRVQHPSGPARSWWQIEPQTAVAVLKKWKDAPARLTDLLGPTAPPDTSIVMVRHCIRFSEVIACATARGILWLDPRPLPKPGEMIDAWDCYVRNWRPGKPRPERWAESYSRTLEAIKS